MTRDTFLLLPALGSQFREAKKWFSWRVAVPAVVVACDYKNFLRGECSLFAELRAISPAWCDHKLESHCIKNA